LDYFFSYLYVHENPTRESINRSGVASVNLGEGFLFPT
jgi:hypothetical protein